MGEIKTVDSVIKASLIIDTKGYDYPLPLLQIKKEINKLTSGQILQINGIDVDSLSDISGWCNRSGHVCLGRRGDHGYISVFIKKG
jgi:tRNA 2-thiouridine synthesizing protein A